MVSKRLGDKKGTNLSNLVRFNAAMKTTLYLTFTSTLDNLFFFISGIKAFSFTVDLINFVIAQAVTGLVDWNTSTITFIGEDWHTTSITWLAD
jgi:hypothetical protein